MSRKKLNLIIIAVLFTIQALYTHSTFWQIRHEEISEAVRNVYWLQTRHIYDGISANIGWYGILLIVYNIFGFTLFTAKFVRLGLYLFSLLALSSLLSKYLREKSTIPLLVFGLSPTLLFFNTLQTSYGIDLQFFPICLYFLDKNKHFLLWFTAMLASLCYPSFLFYLPLIIALYLYRLFKNKKKQKEKFLSLSFFGFLLPLFIAILYLKKPALLFYDKKVNSGLFRAGGGEQIANSLPSLVNNIKYGAKIVYKDIFIKADSYYFEALRVEFSHFLTATAVIAVLISSIYLIIKQKKSRTLLAGAWFLIISTLIASNISSWFPGLRRSTPVLTGFYILYALVWKKSSKIFKIACIIILLHHVFVLPKNLAGLKVPSQHRETSCFNIYKNSPQKSLQYFVNQAQKNEKIKLVNRQKKPIKCREDEIYPAVWGYCLWNNLNCQNKNN